MELSSGKELQTGTELSWRSEVSPSTQIREICELSENSEAVSYIINRLKTEVDLKTVRMLLKFIDGIREFYASQGQALSKDQLADILHTALTDAEIRRKCVAVYGNERRDPERLALSYTESS